MGPLRLIILAILLYLGYRLITGSFRKNRPADDDSHGAPEGQITDVLVEDPVCHALVPKGQAVTHEDDGDTYYFCSEECCRKFVSEKGEEQ